MSSTPLFDVYPDQMTTAELPNGTLARAHHVQETRNRQWGTMTGFTGTPVSFSGVMTDDTFTIKLLVPPYVKYAWPAIFAAGYKEESSWVPFTGTDYFPASVHFTVDTYDSGSTKGSRLEVYTEEWEDSVVTEDFVHAQYVVADSLDFSSKSSTQDTVGSWIQVGNTIDGQWRDIKLNIEVPDKVTVYQVFIFWHHQVVT